jgi:hypothetical protein
MRALIIILRGSHDLLLSDCKFMRQSLSPLRLALLTIAPRSNGANPQLCAAQQIQIIAALNKYRTGPCAPANHSTNRCAFAASGNRA